MADNNTQDSTDERTATDGGVAGHHGQSHRDTDYLNAEVNLLNPSTPFMRDHLRIIWTGFVTWAILVFGPVLLTAAIPDVMTTTMPVIEFPLHYFLVAVCGPSGALILSAWYARKRDQLDAKYGIDHTTTTESGGGGSEDAAATDGGERSQSDRDPRQDAERSDGGVSE
ncbi:DUF4212 domain-containing protein [Haloterrigena sp. SYSU A121-1]|uniref:DUF4212 domain-containing protein n=1 Tax=Haloterrigena gelatinilytica TaxID=2741724 RepID=A0A8J8GJP2_9EURY|nr:DUF4212 domain-containing protein [Haloterrigena gelatinilytica]NUB91219.1 DUF4212 domain-containing protein [Haloterrigena gelatinilytica]